MFCSSCLCNILICFNTANELDLKPISDGQLSAVAIETYQTSDTPIPLTTRTYQKNPMFQAHISTFTVTSYEESLLRPSENNIITPRSCIEKKHAPYVDEIEDDI